MRQWSRLFSADPYKGEENYLKNQTKYEILRTILYFGVSLSLLVAGILATGTRKNLLTIVAVLGCLPAGKSLVSVIMFAKSKGCSPQIAEGIKAHLGSLQGMFDLVFTSYEKNFYIDHLVVRGDTILGISSDEKFDEKAFSGHLESLLKADGFSGFTLKIFRDPEKYFERLDQLNGLHEDGKKTGAILQSIKNIIL